VTPALDHGPIVAHAVVPVHPGDTPQALADRVLAAEHRLLPQAVRWFVEGQLRIDAQGLVHQLGGADQLLIGG
jgi:phosphoribosylglycinamide formyltransferase-1